MTDGCDCYRHHTVVQVRHNSQITLGRGGMHSRYADEADLNGGGGIRHIPKCSADSHASK